MQEMTNTQKIIEILESRMTRAEIAAELGNYHDNDIAEALELMEETYRSGGKILLCGNGGSCADCDHIVGELMKGFLSKRPVKPKFKKDLENLFPDDAEYMAEHLQQGISAISLNSHAAVLSAFANDVAADMVYAQMVYGYGRKNDLFKR